MVSTRHSKSNGGGGGGGSGGGIFDANESCGPAKCTRNNLASTSTTTNTSVALSVYPSAMAMPSTSNYHLQQPQPQQMFVNNMSSNVELINMPQEIIEKICSYLSFKNMCQLRLVCTRIDRICANILNTTFQRLLHQLMDRFQTIKKKMPRRESARRNHHLACESDIIETLHMRLTLLQMSLGKHIERKHCCFFPGEILDEVFNILRYIRNTPKLARPYKVTDELFDLSTMAMEYFKEKIEPDLPEIAYFSTNFLEFSSGLPSSTTNKYLCLDSFPIDMEEVKDGDGVMSGTDCVDDLTGASGDGMDVAITPSTPTTTTTTTPQSTMVLRKGIRKIRQGMKRYNSQLTLLRQDLRNCKRKTADQQKQISEQQKQLAEQQKQTVEYATRLDDNDKKNEEISRKFSTLLQELNKCKTELQYWRSKSPALPPFCTGCGTVLVSQAEEIQALMNQGVNPEGLGLEPSEFLPIIGTAEVAAAAAVANNGPSGSSNASCSGGSVRNNATSSETTANVGAVTANRPMESANATAATAANPEPTLDSEVPYVPTKTVKKRKLKVMKEILTTSTSNDAGETSPLPAGRILRKKHKVSTKAKRLKH